MQEKIIHLHMSALPLPKICLEPPMPVLLDFLPKLCYPGNNMLLSVCFVLGLFFSLDALFF